MEKLNFRQRLKWAAAMLGALLFPIAGMAVSAGTSRGTIGGIAAGGAIGLLLYFTILWQELKLKEHWRTLVLPVFLVGLIAYLLLRRNMPEMAVLMLIYIPVFVTVLPLLQELDKKPVPSGKKPSATSARIGVVALTLFAAAALLARQMFPLVRPLTDGFLWLYAAAVLFGGVIFFVRILLKHVSNGRWQRANRAYRQQCDPCPMLEECQRRLSKRLSKTSRQRWLIQKAAVLSDLGDPTAAIKIVDELLSSGQSLSVQTRWACYYDLADFHCNLGDLEAAVASRIKADDCARQCKTPNTKQWLLDTLYAQEGVYLYHAGEYEQAKERMLECGWNKEDTAQELCTRVFRAYWVGLVFLKTGDTQRAVEKLQFVAEHGNRIYVTAIAKELIS